MVKDQQPSSDKEEERTAPPERPSDKGFTVSDRRHWVRRQQGEPLEEAKDPGERLPTYVEELKAKIEEKEAKLQEFKASFRKMKEEMEAARARMAQDMERRLELHKQEFFARLLPCLDDLNRAVAAGENHQDYEALLKGITMVRDLFFQRLQEEGIQPVATVGEAFDPAVHEAMAVVEVDEPEKDNKVIEELSPGYLYRDHLLRPAQVRVGQLRDTSIKEEKGEEENHADL
jgi:molecular chaperone GrpE